MTFDTDPRTPDLSRSRASVAPFIILIVIVAALAGAMYAYQDQLQALLGSPHRLQSPLAEKVALVSDMAYERPGRCGSDPLR